MRDAVLGFDPGATPSRTVLRSQASRRLCRDTLGTEILMTALRWPDRRARVVLLTLAIAGLSALWLRPWNPDLAFVNGRIYTVDAQSPWADSAVIRDGTFAYVGDRAGATAHIGWNTRVIDLGGKMAMPGLHEGHTHLGAALFSQHLDCTLERDVDPQQIIAILHGCQAANGTRQGWLIGGVYNPLSFPEATPNKRLLDEAFPDTPVFLEDNTGHNALVNSAALRRAGITSETPDPHGGVYVEDPATGELSGLLIDQAQWDFRQHLPSYSPLEILGAARKAMRRYSVVGVTSLQEAAAVAPLLQLLRPLDWAGMIPMDIYAELLWRPGSKDPRTGTFAEQEAAIANRSALAADHIHTDFVKIFVDGVPVPPVPTHSALDSVTGEPDPRMLLVSTAELTEVIRRYDAMGIRVKMHVAGSGAARTALDALERADAGPGHVLAHGQSVVEEDLQRAAARGVILEMSGYLWTGTQFGDQRAEFRFKTAIGHGAQVVIGSDWPIAPDVNPFPALAAMTDLGSESVDRATALRMVTLDAAASVGADTTTGSIRVGKAGTLIVLDRDLFDIDTRQMADTQVLMTVFEGKVVHEVLQWD